MWRELRLKSSGTNVCLEVNRKTGNFKSEVNKISLGAEAKNLFVLKSLFVFYSFLIYPNPPHLWQGWRFGFSINPLPSQIGHNTMPCFSGLKILAMSVLPLY